MYLVEAKTQLPADPDRIRTARSLLKVTYDTLVATARKHQIPAPPLTEETPWMILRHLEGLPS